MVENKEDRESKGAATEADLIAVRASAGEKAALDGGRPDQDRLGQAPAIPEPPGPDDSYAETEDGLSGIEDSVRREAEDRPPSRREGGMP